MNVLTQSGQSNQAGAVFGRRKEAHTVIIARGDDIRHFSIRPWMLAVGGALAAAAFVGYLGATTYLVMRDDLIAATVTRQARMQQAYEDRISALRVQIDRVTSRQLLDQKLMEDKVDELMRRQASLSERQLLIPGDAAAGPATNMVPVPAPRPDGKRADAAAGEPQFRTAYAGVADPVTTGSVFSHVLNDGTDKSGASVADRADRAFVAINKSLKSIEKDQITRLSRLAEDARRKALDIADAARSAGIALKLETDTAKGGPFIEPASFRSGEDLFEAHLDALDEAQTLLQSVREQVDRFPVGTPTPGAPTTSRFGIRNDPFLNRKAMHAGIDFRAPLGAPILASGAGVVVKAGWNGGYGRMVEIDHGKGLTSRYAHMSSLSVSEGDRVGPGTKIGTVGSSGRSTGPHLHYEIRVNGDPVNPSRYLAAGKEISRFY